MSDVNALPSVSLTSEYPLRYRGNDAQEQRLYREVRQHLLGHIMTVMRIMEDVCHHPFFTKDTFTKDTLISDTLADTHSRDTFTHTPFDPVECLQHLVHLRTRVTDSASKILVAGDVNVGKSTLINRILRTEALPTHEQPCTSALCEVVDATQNSGVEEVHCISDPPHYDSHYASTFHAIPHRHLPKAMEQGHYPYYRVYVHDKHTPDTSLLKHDLATIRWIDSPGLNAGIDTGQADVDAIVLVISAHDHLSLSAKHLVHTVYKKKIPLFIIVNKFDTVVDKERCKHTILSQINAISHDPIHFLPSLHPTDLQCLETHLLHFAVQHRLHTKLIPARNYLISLLTHLKHMALVRQRDANLQHQRTLHTLTHDTSLLQLLKIREPVLHQVQQKIESTLHSIHTHSVTVLTSALATLMPCTTYPGHLKLIPYCHDYCDTAARLLSEELEDVQREALEETRQCRHTLQSLGTTHLGPFPWQHHPLSLPLPPAITLPFYWTDLVKWPLTLSVGVLCMGLQWRVPWGNSICGSGSGSGGGGGWKGWASLGVLGLLGLLDVSAHIDAFLAHHCRTHVHPRAFVDTHSQRITQQCRALLASTSHDIEVHFQTAVETQTQRRSQLENVLLEAHTQQAHATHFIQLVSAVLDQVKLISTDVSFEIKC
ncbi:P-loop containing nucleoside triphosphate hydrolase protein [Spinellus fusiger]|nr:P-loop containing nucleoside triphosphate hydrolase protein [Spinellus fusiger]